MPLRINDKNYYMAAEACAMAGISRDTFLRWVRKGEVKDVKHRDRHGWRLFTNVDVSRLRAKVQRIERL